MKLYRSLDSFRADNNHETFSACAMGMFDGLHLGHRMVLESALRQSRLYRADSVVFSFADHPQFLLSRTPTGLLSSLDERLAGFEAMGFQKALILDFDETLRTLSASGFIKDILITHMRVKSVSVGYDHHFGANRQGDGDFLIRNGKLYGFDVQIIDPVRVADQIVSSTLIRKLIGYGEMQSANHLLGRPYTLSGKIAPGFQRGREIGFPTANLAVAPPRIIPAIGTYAGYACLGTEKNSQKHPAVCNVGYCPTFPTEQPAKRVEVHLLDYQGPAELYGRTITMAFQWKLRDEKRFEALPDLIAQIEQDCCHARTLYSETAVPEPSAINQPDFAHLALSQQPHD